MSNKNTKTPTEKNSLKSLLFSIVQSVAKAQGDLIELQVRRVFSYFEKKRKKDAYGNETDEFLPGFFPNSVEVAIPCSNEKEYKTKYYSIPLVNLLHHSHLHMEEITTEFDVGFSDFGSVSYEEPNTNLLQDEKMPLSQSNVEYDLGVDILGAEFSKDKGVSMHVKISMKTHEIPEGAARLLNELINSAQGYSREITTKKEPK